MTGPHDERTPLGPEDAAFVERLKETFTPGALGDVRRSAFDAALAERIDRRRPRRFGAPALAGVSFAVLGAWLLVTADFGPTTSSPGAAAVVAQAQSAAAWEDEVLDVMSFGDIEDLEEGDDLPDDYAAIAAVFLDG